MLKPAFSVVLATFLAVSLFFFSVSFAREDGSLMTTVGTKQELSKDHVEKESQKSRFRILSGKVDVIAVTEYRDEGLRQHGIADESLSFISPHFDLFVKHGKTVFAIGTTPCGGIKNVEHAVSRIKGETHWKSGYLFVPTECGCGNAVHCNRLHVFTIRQGRLIHIGSTAELPDASGYFHDTYGLGDSRISRASSAWFPVAMSEKEGHFIVDLDLTWEENQRNYKAAKDRISQLVNEPSEKQFETLLKPFLFRAALAAYCNRNEELREVLSEAASDLDKEQFEIIEDAVLRVKSGEVPSGQQYRSLDLNGSTITEIFQSH